MENGNSAGKIKRTEPADVPLSVEPGGSSEPAAVPRFIEPAAEAVANASLEAAQVKAASKLLVLAKNHNAVRPTVLFLERRGFAAQVCTTLNEAVELFTRKEANMLLLSVNFAHPKVDMLPKLMQQSFSIETILYSEESDRKSSQRLSNAKSKHVLFGPVSGPVVMMKIRQIDREMNGGDDAPEGPSPEKRALSGSGEDSGDIKVGGRRDRNDDSIVLNGRTGTGSSTQTFDNLLKSLDDDSSGNESGDLARSGDKYVAKGSRARAFSAAEGDGSAEGAAVLSERAQKLRHGLDLGLRAAAADGRRPRLIEKNDFKDPRSFVPLARDDEDSLGLDLEAGARQTTAGERAGSTQAEAGPVDAAVGQANELAPLANKAKDGGHATEHGLLNGGLSAKKPETLTQEQIVQLCLREALAIVAGELTDRLHSISSHKAAALVTIRTKKFLCAFVASLAHAKQTPSEIFHRLAIAFFSLLRDRGIEFDDEQTYTIMIDDLSAARHAFETSEFVVVTRSLHIEIGVAYIHTGDPVALMKPYDDNMFIVPLRDLPLNEPVTYSVFLHFKRNQKFIRYLKLGSRLSSPQIDRLVERNAQALVEQRESEAYKRQYAAQAIRAPRRRAA